MNSKPFAVGDLVSMKDGSINDEPTFIWELIEKNEQLWFLVNSESGMSKKDISLKFPDQKILLPNHAKFKLVNSKTFNVSYAHSSEKDYSLISEWINRAKDSRNLAPDFFINTAYVFMHLVSIGGFKDSQYSKSAEDKIYQDPYSLIVELESILDLSEKQLQYSRNFKYLVTLEFIPKRFVLLKMITKAKDIIRENFPPNNDDLSNSLIEKLLLGMSLSYYKANQDKIKSVTINYGQKFPGDFKVFQQFTTLLSSFENEMKMYENIHEEELKIEFNPALTSLKIPKGENGEGVIMKLLEFDLAFWQRLILLDIDKDVPVRKPYKDGYSESYNYMLLLPYFQWLAPHRFPSYEDKNVNAETYNKAMVERMKSFVKGKIS
ncbi:MAG: hypothetical protein U0T74_01160 [Chitinophagales bacterium]